MKKYFTIFLLASFILLNPLNTFSQSTDPIVLRVYNNYVAGSSVLGASMFLMPPLGGFADIPYRRAVVTYHDEIKGKAELEEQLKTISPEAYAFLEERVTSGLYKKNYKKVDE